MMRNALYVLVVLLAGNAPLSAQTGLSGTWRVDGVGPGFPWEVVLRADGYRLTGAVSSCASRRVEIFDGRIDGAAVMFQCKSLDGDRTIAFTGKVDGDLIFFSRELRVRKGADPIAPNIHPRDGMFGAAAPSRFTAKRVPDGQFAVETDRIRGVELAAAVNLHKQDLKGEGTLFLPHKVARVRAVIVAIGWGLGRAFYDDPQIRRMAEATDSALVLARFSSIGPGPYHDVRPQEVTGGGADGLLMLLQRLAEDSGRPELADAPLVFWGQSAGGPFGTLFAKIQPQRTIAVVRYHSGPLPAGDTTVVTRIPTLFFVGGKDEGATPDWHPESLWRSGRRVAAPWTFAVEPEATHGGVEHMEAANRLVVPWITAVMRLRLSTNSNALRLVTDQTAWLGNTRTGDVASYGTFAGSKYDASWLPDEITARAWRVVVGAVK